MSGAVWLVIAVFAGLLGLLIVIVMSIDSTLVAIANALEEHKDDDVRSL